MTMPVSHSLARNPLTLMANGTLKQINPFSGTEVWTVPGRGNRPLTQPVHDAHPLDDAARATTCAFCSARPLETPPEKARMIHSDGRWEILRGVTPDHSGDTQAEFRRVPNLFEIVPYEYWRENYSYRGDSHTRQHMAEYLSSPGGRDHVLNIVRTRLKAAGENPGSWNDEDLITLGESYFNGGHDLIIGRRHFSDDATDTSGLAGAGSLTLEEHRAFIAFTVDTMHDLYETNRYVQYVAVFQNWLKPAGASFDHLHKQLVSIDERGETLEREISRLRVNMNMYNEWGTDYAHHHNLMIAANEHAVACAGVGHRYPTIEIYSRSACSEPWLQSSEEIAGMSDIIHAIHAATGTRVPTNEEWHHRPPGLDLPMPWRVNLKWRVSTLAGFEGGTKIYVNTIAPEDLVLRVTTELRSLRAAGRIAESTRIGEEIYLPLNSLRYNPLLSM